MDVAVAATGGDAVDVLLGDGQGGFTAAEPIEIQSPASVAARDLDGDGRVDIAVSSRTSSWRRSAIALA